MINADPQFEQRKRDHIQIALSESSQSQSSTGLDEIQLIHEALPDFDLKDVDLQTELLNQTVSAPFFISSMTAGHAGGEPINRALARLSEKRQILMGVGSQRRELFDAQCALEWKNLRREFPKALFVGNLGIAQAIQSSSAQVAGLVENLQAVGLFIHLNPLQEALQNEGTPNFAGAAQALKRLVRDIRVPVVVKETGSGISVSTLKRLADLGVHAVDVSGVGGTHWGQVEEHRLPPGEIKAEVAKSFRNWGLTTAQCLKAATEYKVGTRLWASGGIRNGVDAAKCIAMGAEAVGLARPWLQAAVQVSPDQALEQLHEKLSAEFKVALFCTGARNPGELRQSNRWQPWK